MPISPLMAKFPPSARRVWIPGTWVVVIALLFGLGARVLLWERSAPTSDSPPSSVTAVPATPEAAALASAGTTPGWWAEAQARIARSEYEPKPGPRGLQAPNRAQQFRTSFLPGSVELGPRRSGSRAWKVAWRTIGWGREAELFPGPTPAAVAPAPQVAGARVEYTRDGLVEWYENTPAGLEQGFTIERCPPGEGALVIAGAIGGDVCAKLRPDGAVDFHAEHGCVLSYGKLAVWDAAGRELPARLELAAAGDRVAIRIEDDPATRYPVTVDPLITAAIWSFEANQLLAHLGESVATAGDVNGDGYSDVVVGAPQYDNGQDLEGRAVLFLGSATGPSIAPDWIGESNVTNARFGNAVAAAGDVNGDGFDDVIVGAFALSNGQTSEGRAYVFHGSAGGLGTTPAWTFESNQVGAFLGFAVGTAGDVNGDGFADVVVGSNQFSNNQLNEGRAFVFHGSASGLAATAAWTGEPDVVAAKYGCSVGTAGDVNGDGFADVIVGAEDFSNGQMNEGAIFLYLGSATGLPAGAAAMVVESNLASVRFGRSVGTAGDVNGDGYADIIAGASLLGNGQGAEGRVYVYHGSATLPTQQWMQESNIAGAQFGHSVATAGDVNGDGFADVLIGAPMFTGGQSNEGRFYLYQGSATGLELLPTHIIDSNRTGTQLGFSVGTAGDVNGDGYADVIAGANVYDNGEGDEGAAFVYLGLGGIPSFLPAWTAESNQASAFFAWVAAAGDVNGDGYSDVVVGAEGYDNGEDSEGRAYAFHGSANGLSTTPAWVVESNRELATFGIWAGTAGDVNGDGYSDVVVAARNYPLMAQAAGGPEGINGNGKVYVYHGSPAGLGLTPAWTAEVEQEQSSFGYPSRTAGDVNGDGYGDLLVAANLFDNGEGDEGKAFLYEGSPAGLQLTPAWTVEGNQAGVALGSGLGPAGDVNGDGYSDVLIGVPFYSNGQSHEGEVRLYLGSASGLESAPAWRVESNRPESLFGFILNTAGDVNGDGYSDVLAGSQFYSDPEHWEGKLFEYDGSALGLATTPSWMVESNQVDRLFGSVAGTAGDVNGDGYSDVIVSDPNFVESLAMPLADEGRVVIYAGSPAGLSIAQVYSASQNQPGAHFGFRSGTAGDVNGDGFSDIVASSALFDNGEADEGRAFLYYGNGGDGLDRLPRQRRADNTAPIDLLGASNSTTSFRLDALGRTPAGRGRVRLQVEVKPLGVAFDGTGLITGPPTLTGVPGLSGSAVALSAVPGGLAPGDAYRWRLRFTSRSPFFPHSRWFSPAMNGPGETDLRTRVVVGVEAAELAPPAGAAIERVAPNPFGSSTEITYVLPRAGRHRLLVYDVTGREVAVLAAEPAAVGRHLVRWDGRDAAGRELPAGVYFVALEFGDSSTARKITLTR